MCYERERPGNRRNASSSDSYIQVDDNISFNDSEILELIDQYGGHPNDPSLPDNMLGATDMVLSSTNPRELADIITLGEDIAKSEIRRNPRFLFALARIALELGYYEKGAAWIDIAAQNGSIPALAYQGYFEFSDGNLEIAISKINEAKDSGFYESIMDEIDLQSDFSINDFSFFNRPDIIKALYEQDIGYLNQNKIIASYYIGTIQNTLWETDILFLVENTNFVLELDPEVSVKLGFPSKKAKEFGFVSASKWLSYFSDYFNNRNLDVNEVSLITEQAIQDARRIALIYDTDPEFFTKVYNSVKKFSDEVVKFE
jgi:hypothetical protein